MKSFQLQVRNELSRWGLFKNYASFCHTRIDNLKKRFSGWRTSREEPQTVAQSPHSKYFWSKNPAGEFKGQDKSQQVPLPPSDWVSAAQLCQLWKVLLRADRLSFPTGKCSSQRQERHHTSTVKISLLHFPYISL